MVWLCVWLLPVACSLLPLTTATAAERLYLGTGEYDASRDWGAMLRFEQSDSINGTAVCPDGTVNWFMSKDSNGIRPAFGHAMWNNDAANELYVAFIFTKTDNTTCSTVANGGGTDTCGSIGIVNGASTAKGPVTLSRHIVGAATRLNLPHGAWVDASRDLLYIANTGDSSILIYRNASTVNGNVAPDTVLKTDTTYDPVHLYVDTINDRLFVVHRKAGHNGESPAISVWNNASHLGGTNSTPAMRIYGGNSYLDSGNNQTTHNVVFDSASQFMMVGHHTSEVLFYPMKNINWSPAVRDTAPRPYALRDHDGTDTFDWSTYGFYYLASRDRLYAATGYTSPGSANGSGPPNIGSPKNVVRVYENVSQINSDTNPTPARKIYWDNGGTYLPPQPLWVAVYPDAARAPRDWYVNDAYLSSADSFTYVGGSDTAGAGTANYPFRSIPRALQCAKQGDTIYVDAGRYNDTYVNVSATESAAFKIDTDYITIIGKDSYATVIDPPDTAANFTQYGIYADTQKGLTIKNLGVTGAQHGVYFLNVDSSTLAGDSFSSNGSAGIKLDAGSDSNTVSSCMLYANGFAGVNVASSAGNTVTNNLIQGNVAMGVMMDGCSSGVVSNNTVTSNPQGLEASTCTGITVTGNTVTANSGDGLTVFSSANCVVTNNVFRNNSPGISLFGAAGNVFVQNTLDSNGNYQISISGASSSDTFIKNNITPSSSNPDSAVTNSSSVTTNKFSMTRNWWGTTDEITIRKRLFHDGGGDSVTFSPYRLAAVDTSAGGDTTAPALPTGVTCTAATGYITVTWTIPTLNEETNGGNVAYGGAKIYRLTNTVDTTNWANPANLVRTSSSTETQWNDTTVSGGSTYYYRLSSLDTAAFVNQSFLTDTKSATATAGTSTARKWFVNDTYSSSADSFTYAGGADTSSGTGAETSPYRSVAKAMQSAKSGDTIYVDAGLYVDTYVVITSGSETAAFKIDTDNLAIIGKDSGATVFDPPGANTVAGVYGVYASNRTGLTIKNIGVTGVYYGIYFTNVDASTVWGDSCGSNGNFGIYLVTGSDSNTVRNCQTNANTNRGIVLATSSGNTIQNNFSTNNGSDGINLSTGSNANWLADNVLTSNSNYGVRIYSASNNNLVRNNFIRSNLWAGVSIAYADTNTVTMNDISLADTGVQITDASRGNLVVKNNITNNTVNNLSNDSGLPQSSLARNWWGSTDESAIAAKFKDTGNNYRPYRLGVVDTASGADTTAPLPPVNVTLDTGTPNFIKLTWTIPTLNEETNGGSVGYAGAKIYRIFNSPDTTNWASSSHLVRVSSSTETNWTDTQVVSGNTYYYRLISLDTAGFTNQSFFTDTKWTALQVVVTCSGNEVVPTVANDTFERAWSDTPQDTVIPGATATATIVETAWYRTYWLGNGGAIVTDTSSTGDSYGKQVSTGVSGVNGTLEGFIRNPAVWKFSSSNYVMIYEALESGSATTMRFFRATSANGITFTRTYDGLFDSGAVMIPGPDETGFISVPDLHYHNGFLYMYYVSGGKYSAVARSADTGKTWTKLGRITIEGLPAGHRYVDPDVITDSHGRRILFFAYDNGTGQFGKGGIKSAVAMCDTDWLLEPGARVMPDKASNVTLDPDVVPQLGKNGAYRVYYGLGDPTANQYDLRQSKSPDSVTTGNVWYVNDTSTTGDSFTTAAGYDTNPGNFRSSPFRTINKALMAVKSGDTIYVDAGLYDSYVRPPAEADTAGINIDTNYITLIGKDSSATVIDPPGPAGQDNAVAIYADSQVGLTIKNIGVTGVAYGIAFINVKLSTITGDSASNCGFTGILLTSDCESTVITGCIASYDSQNGIRIDNSSFDTVSGNITDSNGIDGISLGSAVSCYISDNLSRKNAAHGIYISDTLSANNTLVNNRITDNAAGGISLITAGSAFVRNNHIANNRAGGLEVNSCSNVIVAQNTFDSNALYQIDIGGASASDTFFKNNIRTSPSNPDSGVQNTASQTTKNAFVMTRNWWDTTDEVSIKRRFYQAGGVDSITFSPYRLGPVDTTAGADTTAPALPIGVTCTAAATAITVTWAIPTVSEETNGGAVGYSGAKIYRLTNTADTNNWANPANLVRTASSTDTQWTDTLVTAGSAYYYRLTSFDAATIVNQSFLTDTKSGALPSGSKWYVNDTATSADSFTYAGGSDTSYGDGSQQKPWRSVVKALQNAKSGDTIYVDAGLYVDTWMSVSASETAAFKIDTDNLTVIGKDSGSTVFDPPGPSTSSGVYGIYADTQSGLVIKNIGVTGAYDGFHFENLDSSVLSADSVVSAGNNGIYLLSGSESNVLENNFAIGAINFGIYLFNGPRRNLVTGNTANSNSQVGIYLSTAETNTVAGNTANSNSLYGVYLSPNAHFNTVSGNTAGSNGRVGIFLNGVSNGNSIVNNSVDTNNSSNTAADDRGGIVVGQSRLNVVSGNTCRANGHQGIYINDTSETNVVRGNFVSNNLSYGIGVNNSRWNVIEQNRLDSNAQYQFLLNTGSTADTFSKNNIRTSPSNPDSAVLNNVSGQKYVFTRNWWDTTDEVSIRKKIASVEAGDSIAFSPYRLGPVDTSVGADTTAPAPPVNVTLSPDTVGQILVSWTIPTINEETNGGSVSYNGAKIYRLANTVDTTSWANNLVWTASSSATSWTDTTSLAGNTYYYRLSSIDTASIVNQSFFSDTKSAKATRTVWYVNDTYSAATDSFTYIAGSDTGSADGSPSKPYRSVARVMQSVKSGDTVYVDAGYYRDTYVNVSSTETAAFKIDTDNIMIIGKDSTATTICPAGPGPLGLSTAGLYGIYADTQSGLVIKNLGVTGAHAGIYFVNVDQSMITGDSVTFNADTGIYLTTGSDSNIVSNNKVDSNGLIVASISGYGIWLSTSSNNTISNNSASSNLRTGITLFSSSNNIVSNNNASSNSWIAFPDGVGVKLLSSSNNTVSNNKVNSNLYYGIYLTASSYDTIINNSVDSNYPSPGTGFYSITLDNCTNVMISGNSSNWNQYGIVLTGCTNNTVVNNTTSFDTYGIYVAYSSSNIVNNNVVSSNILYGLYLTAGVNNSFIQNTIDSNTYAIYILGKSSSDTFSKNNIRTADSSIFNGSTDTAAMPAIILTRNWWYTTDEAAVWKKVNSFVHTGGSAGGGDSIIFSPIRLGIVDTTNGADTTAPAPPTNVAFDTSLVGVIKITWNIPTINEETNGGSVSYTGAKIYRLKNLADTGQWADSATLVYTASATETSWTDTNVRFGDTYYYRLTSYDAATFVNQSYFSDTKWVTATSVSSVRVFQDSVYTDDVDTSFTRAPLYIEVRDSDENRSGAAVETVTVVVYVGNGTTEGSDTAGKVLDTETIILTESGANTGIFRSDTITLTDTIVPVVGDGKLSWGRSDTIHVKYVDANDATDSASDTALALEIPTAGKITLFEDPNFTDDVDTYKTRDVMYVSVQDTDENKNPQFKDTVTITAYIGLNTSNYLVTDTEIIVLTESSETTGIFRSVGMNLTDTVASLPNNGFLTWATSDTLHVAYVDPNTAADSASDTALLVDTDLQPFTGPIWYVNDSSVAGDVFTTQVGSDTSGNGSAVAPYRTVMKALSVAKSSETIYIDAGLYNDTFVNTSSTETAAFKIDTDYLTIIGKDSNTTVIDPPGPNSAGFYGVYADTQVGLIIKTLGVTGAFDGIKFVNVDSSTLSGDSLGGNGNSGAYFLNGSDSNIVTGVTASNNVAGFFFASSSKNRFTNNLCMNNAGISFNLTAGSGNTLSGNIASNNSDVAFYVNSSNGNILTNNRASNNALHGFYLSSAADNILVMNTADSNARYQFYIDGSSSSDTVQKNNIKTSSSNSDSAVYNASTVGGNKFTFTRNWWGTTDEVAIKKMLNGAPMGVDSIVFIPYRFGAVDTGIGGDTTAPGLPTSVTLDTGVTGQIKVSWTIPTINEETNGGSVGYNGAKIYRLRNLADTNNWANSANLVWIAGASDSSWTDTGVTGGDTYYYRLTSLDSATFVNQSFFTDTKSTRADSAWTGPKWYVNDTYSSTADSFAYAGGSDTPYGDGSVTRPFRSVARALQKAKSTDTIYVDAGLYVDTYVTVSSTETAAFKIDTDFLSIIGKDSSATVIDPPGSAFETGVYGIYADTQTNLLIQNIGVTGASIGIYFFNVDTSTIVSDSISRCGYNSYQGGMILKNSDSGTLSNNVLLGNSIGMYLFGGCHTNKITNNMAVSDTIYGLVVEKSFGNTVNQNTVTSNGTGILLYGASNSTCTANTASSNNTGILLWEASIDTAGGNTCTGNTSYGMRLLTCTTVTVTANLIASNSQYGIFVDTQSQLNTIRNNKILGNSRAGLVLLDADTNVIVQNDIASGDTGLLITGSSRFNTVTKNNFTNNAVNQIYNSGGLVQTTITRNWYGSTDEVAVKITDSANVVRPYRLGAVDTSVGADTTAPGLPASVTLDTGTAGQIKVTWTIPTVNEETNGGSVGYAGAKIYRLKNTVDTNNWANSANLVWIAGATDTSWSDTGASTADTFYYRLTSIDTGTFVNQSFFTDTKFALAVAAGTTAAQKWYVNDTYSSSADSFTYAGGSDTSYGDGSLQKPWRSLAKAMQNVKQGDTVYVDAGLYTDTYVSVSSTETAAFKIDTDYITIIGKDSNATVIDPPGANSISTMYGIYADTQVGLVIQNLGVTGAYDGIKFVNVDKAKITGDSFSSNGEYGLNLLNGSDTNTINNNLVGLNTTHGVNLQAGSFNTFSNNTVRSNPVFGIYMDAGANNIVFNNTLSSNNIAGLELNTCSNTIVANNLLASNGQNGVVLFASTNNTLVQNSFDSNVQYQIDISGGSALDTVQKNNFKPSTTNPDSAVNNGSAVVGNKFTFTRNWWGTTDEVAIKKKIFHPGGGDSVTFSPYRFGQVDTNPGGDSTAPGRPDSFTLDTTTAGVIKVVWTIPTVNEETNGGAVGYSGAKIYRLTNTADTNNWANSANLAWTASSTATSWSDTTVTAGNTYYYRLTSFDTPTLVNQSFFTDTKASKPSSASAGSIVDSITIDSGNHQLTTISTRLGSPLRVRLTDSAGTAIAYSRVTFAISSTPSTTGGYFRDSSALTSTDSAWTDSSGYVQDTFTFGTTRGVYLVTATSDSNSAKKALFYEYADGVDLTATKWKMVATNKKSTTTFGTLTAGMTSPTGYTWKEDAGVSAGLSEYTLLSSSSTIDTGRSYWTYTASSGGYAYVSGTTAFDTVRVSLTAGWHMISSGQYFYVDWDSGVQFDTNGTKYYPVNADSKGIIKNVLYWYNGSGYYWGPDKNSTSLALTRVQMKPMIGFWLYTPVSCTMWVYPNPASPAETSTIILQQAPGYPLTPALSPAGGEGVGEGALAAKYSEGGSDQDWVVSLAASSGEQGDFQNYVGAKATAEAANQAAVYDPPPAAGGYVALGILGDDGVRRAASYVEPITSVKAWKVSLGTDMDTPVVVSWANVASVPQKYAAYLIGGPAGPIDMRKTSSMSLSSSALSTQYSGLTMVVGLPEFLASYLAAPLTKDMTFVYPNPGPDYTTGNITFKYNLQASADVTLRIFDVGGRLVRELKQTGAAGSNLLPWDTTNGNGQRLGSGVYIYILQSGETKLVDKLAIIR